MRFPFVLSVMLTLSAPLSRAGVAELFFGDLEATRDANVGVLVVDVKKGEVVDAYGENRLLPPASTLKLLTTCTALELLGDQYRWETLLETDGALEDGVLKGNLYVRGTGDPTLASAKVGDVRVLEEWVERLCSMGLRRLEGGVVADLSMWDNDEAVNPGWLWKDMGNYYGAAVYPISYRDNTMKLYLESGAKGTVARLLETDPALPELVLDSRVRCTDVSFDNAYVYGAPLDYNRFVAGEIPSNRGRFPVKADLPDPGLLLARRLTELLREAGVEVAQAPSCKVDGFDPEAYGRRRTLYVHQSPPLSEVIRETNRNSNNLYAESIFRTLGMQKDAPATVVSSLSRIREFWQGKGIDLSRSILEDGCGLAPQNGLAPSTLVSLLRYMYRSPHAGMFLYSLPVAGQSGTLRNFLSGSFLQNRVYAKSGTLDHLKSYAGYIFLPDDRVWAFSIVVHNAKGTREEVQKAIERYLLSLSE